MLDMASLHLKSESDVKHVALSHDGQSTAYSDNLQCDRSLLNMDVHAQLGPCC